MEDHIAARLKPVQHTPEDQAIVDRVNRVRTAAARIYIKAGVKPGFHPKPGFYDDKFRRQKMGEDAEEIIRELAGWPESGVIRGLALRIYLGTSDFWRDQWPLQTIVDDAWSIIDQARQLYPNQPVLRPAQNLKFL